MGRLPGGIGGMVDLVVWWPGGMVCMVHYGLRPGALVTWCMLAWCMVAWCRVAWCMVPCIVWSLW